MHSYHGNEAYIVECLDLNKKDNIVCGLSIWNYRNNVICYSTSKSRSKSSINI